MRFQEEAAGAQGDLQTEKLVVTESPGRVWSREGCEESRVVGCCDGGPQVYSLLVTNTSRQDKEEGPRNHSLEKTCSRCPRRCDLSLQVSEDQ